MITCLEPPCNGRRHPGRTISDFLAHQRTHTHPDINDWRTRAVTAVRNLAATGRDFTFYEVAQAAGEPENPRSDWGRFATEIHHLAIAEPVGWTESKRPTSAKSGVKVWRGIKKVAA